MGIEKTVIDHYSSRPQAEAILALARQKTPAPLTPDDLAPWDDMHIGGRKATAYFLESLDLKPGMKILDIGSGLGGPARQAAAQYGVHVTGIDLTPAHKDAAQALSEATGMQDRTAFITGDGKSLPFADESFDGAFSIHTGMNIADKAGFYRETARILKPGALFGLYEIFAQDESAPLLFPLPWADTGESSALATPDEAASLMEQAGFQTCRRESRRDFAMQALSTLLASETAAARRDDFPVRIRNLLHNIESGLCAPWVIAGRKQTEKSS